MKSEELAMWLIENKWDQKKDIRVRIVVPPESVGGVARSSLVDIEKIELEDDGSITILVLD